MFRPFALNLPLLLLIFGAFTIISGSSKQSQASASFCSSSPSISHLFRIANRLYLELASFPGHFYLFYLNNSTFAPELVNFTQIVGKENGKRAYSTCNMALVHSFIEFHSQTEHIFSSIISASSMTEDYFIAFSAESEDIDEYSEYAFPVKRHSKSRNYRKAFKRELKETQKRPLTKATTSNSFGKVTQANSSNDNLSADQLRRAYPSTVPIRIWGHLDTGAFPLEQLLPRNTPFPAIGYEDFTFSVATGRLVHLRENIAGIDYWPARRTTFPFDCFIHLPEYGPIAIVRSTYRAQIMTYQVERPRSRSWYAEPFDVPLKVFYSDDKYDSCVELNATVGLLSEGRQITIVSRDDLTLSFRSTTSKIITSAQIDLFDLLCVSRGKHGLSRYLERLLEKAEAETVFRQAPLGNLADMSPNYGQVDTKALAGNRVNMSQAPIDGKAKANIDSAGISTSLMVIFFSISAIFASLITVACVLLFYKRK